MDSFIQLGQRVAGECSMSRKSWNYPSAAEEVSMGKALRLRIATEYLGRLTAYADRKRALLDIKKKWGASRRSIDRYVAELRLASIRGEYKLGQSGL